MAAEPSRSHPGFSDIDDADGSVPLAARMAVGWELRQRRKSADLTVKAAARHIRASESKISRMENGRHNFRLDEMDRLLCFYGTTDLEERRLLLEQADQANQAGWWADFDDVTPPWLRTLFSLESHAYRIRSFETACLPGLVQTEEYARAVVRLGYPGASEEDIDRRVRLRMSRQRQFADLHDTKLWCLLDQNVLQRPYGAPGVMKRQLEHLVELLDQPRYVFQLVETKNPHAPVFFGPMTILEFQGWNLPDVAYTERLNGARFSTALSEVDGYRKAFDRLAHTTLKRPATADFLRRATRP